MDAAFVSSKTLDHLPTSSQVGKTRVGGIDLNKPRTRAVLSAILSLACCPDGFTAGQLADRVRSTSGIADSCDDARRTAYDIKKLRGKDLLSKPPKSRRCLLPRQAVRTIAALSSSEKSSFAPSLPASANPPQATYQRTALQSTSATRTLPRHVHP
jgi:hypothetical protein